MGVKNALILFPLFFSLSRNRRDDSSLSLICQTIRFDELRLAKVSLDKGIQGKQLTDVNRRKH